MLGLLELGRLLLLLQLFSFLDLERGEPLSRSLNLLLKLLHVVRDLRLENRFQAVR